MLQQGDRYAVVTGKGYRPRIIPLERAKPLALLFLFGYFTLSLFLPFVVLVWASLLPYIQVPSAAALASVSLSAYGTVLQALDVRVLMNTVALVVSVGLLVAGLSLATSWVVVRTRYPGRRLLDMATMLPHATPSIALGFAVAFVALALASVVPLYGSVAAIVLAHTVAFVSFGTRTANSALLQVHRELEEAAFTAGASAAVALRRIILPLIAPAVFYTMLWVGLLSLREVSMALFLQRPQNTVLATQIWNYWVSTNPAEAAALGTMLIVVVAVGCGALLQFAAARCTDAESALAAPGASALRNGASGPHGRRSPWSRTGRMQNVKRKVPDASRNAGADREFSWCSRLRPRRAPTPAPGAPGAAAPGARPLTPPTGSR